MTPIPPGIVVHACNPNIQEEKGEDEKVKGSLHYRGWLRLHETFIKKKNSFKSYIISFQLRRRPAELSDLAFSRSVTPKTLTQSIYPGELLCLDYTLYLLIPMLHKSQNKQFQVAQPFKL